MKAEVVNLDLTLGGASIGELSPIDLLNLRASRTGRQNILKILPRLRKIACEIKRLHNADMLAIGKESVPVRIAELTAGAKAILFVCMKVADNSEPVLLGLPLIRPPRVHEDHVYLYSLLGAEHDVLGYAVDVEEVLTKVKMAETLTLVHKDSAP